MHIPRRRGPTIRVCLSVWGDLLDPDPSAMNNILVQTKNKGKDDDEAWKMEESTEAIFGDDTDSDDDTLRGVSNVVYRKE